MGYESKLYIVDKHPNVCNDNMVWGEVIATFDLCKVYAVSEVIRNKYPATKCYIYADNGNDRITEDLYGDRLIEIPIDDMIRIIDEVSKNDDYRRFAPCLALLKGFDLRHWEDLVVLHYGH